MEEGQPVPIQPLPVFSPPPPAPSITPAPTFESHGIEGDRRHCHGCKAEIFWAVEHVCPVLQALQKELEDEKLENRALTAAKENLLDFVLFIRLWATGQPTGKSIKESCDKMLDYYAEKQECGPHKITVEVPIPEWKREHIKSVDALGKQSPQNPIQILGPNEEVCVACGAVKARGYMCSVCFGPRK